MKTENAIKHTFYIFIPLYILFIFPFPAKLVGYSLALWMNDLLLVGYMSFIILYLKFTVPKTNTLLFLLFLLSLNLLGVTNSIIQGNVTSIRIISEIARTIEFLIIYIYFCNVIKRLRDRGISFEKSLKHHLTRIAIFVFIISIIELFNLPLKDLLRNIYEMSKSGNIFQYYNRIVGTLRNPNFYGLWLSVIIMFFYTTNMRSVYKALMIAISGIFLYFTGSRTSMLAFVIAFFIIIMYRVIKLRKSNNVSFMITGFIAIIIYYLVLNFQELFYSVRLQFDYETWKTLGGRLEIWQSYFIEIVKHPLFGVGIQKRDDLIFDNAFLQYAYYYGIIGVFFLIVFLSRNVFLNMNKIKMVGDRDTLLYFFMAVQVIFFISTLTVQILDVLPISIFYLMGMSYLDTHYQRSGLLND